MDVPSGKLTGGTTSTIVYRPLDESRLEEICDLYIRCFSPDNAIVVALAACEGGKPEEHYKWLRPSIEEWQHRKDCWLIAVEEESDRIVGMSINVVLEPSSPDPWVHMRNQSEFCDMLLQFFGEIVGDYNVFEDLSTSKVLYRLLTTVDQRYRRRGIASELFRRTSLELGPAAGCTAVIGLATSKFTERAWNRLKFREVRRLDYRNSTLASHPRCDFSRLGPHAEAVMMVLPL